MTLNSSNNTNVAMNTDINLQLSKAEAVRPLSVPNFQFTPQESCFRVVGLRHSMRHKQG